MNFNIVTAVQERMGFGPFEKIDPNYRAEKSGFQTDRQGSALSGGLSDSRSDHYVQAATMAVLVGLYRYGSDREGATDLSNAKDNSLLARIFKGQQETISREVAVYRSGVPGARNEFAGSTIGLMQQIMEIAIRVLREQEDDKKDEPGQIQKILAGQRHNILAYLPAEIMVGRTLEDNSLDDRTNKMEGPVSGLMHFIENVFAEKE
jgi:hypothetical protein